jgi:acyl-CoA reductase-like NAD-dependent aldehyde dehydrogenase
METERLDAHIATLKREQNRWASLPMGRRIQYLRGVLDGTAAVADRQVSAAMVAKGITPGTPLEAEDYLAGPVVQLRTVRLMLETLEAIERNGRPLISESAIRELPDGRVAVEVFPRTTIDKLTFAGFRAEIWMQEGVHRLNLFDRTAEFYRRDAPEGAVALVLGAGNVASIGPLDVVHKLFVEGQVCLLKMNPVNAYLGPYIEETFAELIRDGFVRVVYGGADVGAYLCQHPDVDEIHITGSDRTHDIIVFGPGPEGAERKAKNAPVNTKRITSELGNVTPVIVVPGHWTEDELRFQAENVATQIANNASFNCNAAKVLVMETDWPQKRAFLDMLRAVLATLPPRLAYYPGARGRYDQFTEAHPEHEPIGSAREGCIPWTFISGVPATRTDDVCFRTESFCAVFSQTDLEGATPEAFLANAVTFCNETLWGTLAASIIVHPKTEARLGAALEQAIADLRYGSVVINHWPGLCYGLGATAWGAYPGHTADDIQSGVGAVHNAMLFDKPQKSVIYGPFKMFPKPPWFSTHRRAHQVAKRLVAMEHRPSLKRFPGIAFNAARG